ncbi:restriction endonuclease subunit S [Natroniella sp. ANB-PHB2]|uniref:restriction endonuclease subunit S n=1 Tax=Natroniella sp. ANB-PHB2 TaxID=3384444 RepID=UPI0038D41359
MGNEVKEGYKKSSMGIIPEDWDLKPLKEVCKFKNGKSADYYSELDKGRYLIYGSNGPIGSIDDFNLEDGFIVGRVGAVGEIHFISNPVWVSDNAIKMELKKGEKIEKNYLYYWLKRRKLGQFATKSAQPLLNQSTVKSVPIPFPLFPEQEKIADILSVVDGKLQKIDQIIEKTKELKKGLMQELLTKGIGHSEFKKTEFGQIPLGWEFCRMSKVVDINPSYDIPEQDEFLFLEMAAVNTDKPSVDYWIKRNKKDCTSIRFKRFDTLFARITPCTENGKTSFIEELDNELAFGSTELIVFSPKKDLVYHKYVYYLAKSHKIRSLAISMMEGSTGRQRVPREIFNSAVKVPLPPLEEQKKIADILSSVDEKIQKKEEEKEKVERLKKGLMQKLLTGEKRTVNSV